MGENAIAIAQISGRGVRSVIINIDAISCYNNFKKGYLLIRSSCLIDRVEIPINFIRVHSLANSYS